MDQQIDLIGKKLSGSLSQSEEKAFIAMMKDTSFQKLYKKYERIWVGSREYYSVMNTQSILKKVLSDIEWDQNANAFSQQKNTIGHKRQLILKIAASLIILIALSFAVYWKIGDIQDDVEISQHSEQIIKKNPSGQKSTVFLPDGSIVVLNSESSISYPTAFKEQSREVELIGEAFFEVEPNAKLPFIVKTDAMDIRVLGTSFNVNADSNSMKYKISLVTGEVEVVQNTLPTAANDKIILFPGQAIEYSVEEKAFSDIVSFNPKAEYGWKNGLIFFEKASFEEVLSKLKKWYGVDFEIDGKPDNEWHYSGEFDNYALNNVLYALSFTGRFTYKIEGKKVSVKF